MRTAERSATLDPAGASSTSTGTMSMPIESLPGRSEVSPGFIVDRYRVLRVGEGEGGVSGSIGTSRMPQIPQSPGRSEIIVGCIGQ